MDQSWGIGSADRGGAGVFATKTGERIKDIKKGFTTACRKAGIENVRPHDCRHTPASWLVMEGVPLRTVKKILRHSSITVTEQYAHLEPMVARAGVGVLDVTTYVTPGEKAAI